MRAVPSVNLPPWPGVSGIPPTEKLLVSSDAGLYHFINQGVLTVDNMDDEEEMFIADVCMVPRDLWWPVNRAAHGHVTCDSQ